MSSNSPNSLVDFYERLLRRLRGKPSPLVNTHRGQPMDSLHSGTIDLVGGSSTDTSQQHANTTGDPQDVATFGRPGPEPVSGPGLLASPSGSALASRKPAMVKQWQFSQAVLLKKKGQGARILLWTGIGTFVLVGIWAFVGTLAKPSPYLGNWNLAAAPSALTPRCRAWWRRCWWKKANGQERRPSCKV